MSHPAMVAQLLRERARADYWIPVRGTSMAPVLVAPAEVRVVPRDARPLPGQVWAFVSDDGDVVVHRFLWRRRGRLVFAGDANDRKDAPVTYDRLVGQAFEARWSGGRSTQRIGSSICFVWRWFVLGFRRRLRLR